MVTPNLVLETPLLDKPRFFVNAIKGKTKFHQSAESLEPGYLDSN